MANTILLIILVLIVFLILMMVSSGIGLLRETVILLRSGIELTQQKELSLSAKCENSSFIIRLVSGLVEDEVNYLFKEYYILNKKYEMIRLDEDVAVIAQKIFASLDPSIFGSNEIVLTEKYLMQLITEECCISMMRHAIEHNKQKYSS